MNPRFIPILVLLVLVSLAGIFWCSRKPSEKKDAENTDSSTVAPAFSISNVKFYLETSGSMEGYFKGRTEFKDVVNNFVTDLDAQKGRAKIEFFLIDKDIKPYEASLNDFIKDVAGGNFSMGQSSEIHQMIEKIGKIHKDTEISIFISDCILSYSSQEIKKNTEINVQNVESVLKPYVKAEFSKLQRRGLAVSVYALQSNFNGKYFNYRNQVVNCSDCLRPYYVWVIGKSELLYLFEEKIEKMNFPYKENLTLGTTPKTVSAHALFPKAGARNYQINSNKLQNIERISVKAEESIDFFLALNLAELPPKYQDAAFLKQNLRFQTGDKVKVEVVEINPTKEFIETYKNERLKPRLLEYTHIIEVRAYDLLFEQADVKVELEQPKTQNWVANWHTLNDLDPTQATGKTFALQQLIDGVKEAYALSENKPTFLIQTQFSLTKKK
ncbi:hypothetical protein [Hugenholtzia roseola]|uniref:hypothetical protein n=1 Tax=Hugenholtzia roseola TaxID=1002 RepID=UPI000410295A|nr:hypothetical protein [Hugenholtzia roseola]